MTAVSPADDSREQTPKEPNVLTVVLGNLLIKPWYPSFYPEDLVGKRVDRLYVCDTCFRYSKELMPYLAHIKVCPQKEQPSRGSLIYATHDHSIYEIDGEEHKLYCQNLSLFAKLFLDTKSVFYDVSTFRYYLLLLNDPNASRPQIVGFFSKEKMSWDSNNIACILIFPPWQKRGLGQILMGVSYELSRREGRLGGPEKPLSSLGRRAYIAYWSAAICRSILGHDSAELSVGQIVLDTWIQPEDVIAALNEMDLMEPTKDSLGRVVLRRDKLGAWAEIHKIPLSAPIDPQAFHSNPGEDEEMESDDK
ncbi:hypothetical protein AAFC00_001090 [Neodothiora populina]|uniref:histone acetyltransferase n=1 Tax=Neodothiora populina TaxID=2781224 RepID=A0ABR3PNS9_9PEZI